MGPDEKFACILGFIVGIFACMLLYMAVKGLH